MSTLVVHIPPRPRLSARAEAAVSDTSAQSEYAYVRSTDGLVVDAQGQCAAALLPKANTRGRRAVRQPTSSWHRITLPKAPAARLRAALVGVLEEALLDDADAVHLALAPQPVAGQPTWVAAVNRPWLRGELANAAARRRLRRPHRAAVLARRSAGRPLRQRRGRRRRRRGHADLGPRRRRRQRCRCAAVWRTRSCRARRRRPRTGARRRPRRPRPSPGSARRSP